MAKRRGGEVGSGKARSVVPREEAGAIPVLYRVTRAHRDALQDAARRMRDEEGGRGRVNASAALRALLSQWIAGGCKLPPKSDKGVGA
jgi:hypothetical protein